MLSKQIRRSSTFSASSFALRRVGHRDIYQAKGETTCLPASSTLSVQQKQEQDMQGQQMEQQEVQQQQQEPPKKIEPTADDKAAKNLKSWGNEVMMTVLQSRSLCWQKPRGQALLL